jgi:hypothetical protein
MMAIINENMFVLCLSLENRYRVLKSRENVQIIDNNRKPLFFLLEQKSNWKIIKGKTNIYSYQRNLA